METRFRILIVDDSRSGVDALRRLLSDEYETETACDGLDCLEKVRTFEPDLVLLDVVMPNMDGYEACRRIKSSPCAAFTQVILVSGKASTDERLRGYEAQADDYLAKPFHCDELLSKIRVQIRLCDAVRRLWEAHDQITTHNDQLESLVAERTAEIVATQDVAVFALARLADSRDPETGEHLERIRAYTQILADQLSREGPYQEIVDDRFLGNLYRASPLHDIGKVGISDSILRKPGPLTDEEFEAMKQHVLVGAETLDDAARHSGGGRFLTMAAEVARYHHERFNGTGYCQGLSGHDIPLPARVVALADVYDALTSARVYKSAYDPDKARAMILDESNAHFDPAIVDAFIARFDDFQKVLQIGPETATPAIPGKSAVGLSAAAEFAALSTDLCDLGLSMRG